MAESPTSPAAFDPVAFVRQIQAQADAAAAELRRQAGIAAAALQAAWATPPGQPPPVPSDEDLVRPAPLWAALAVGLAAAGAVAGGLALYQGLRRAPVPEARPAAPTTKPARPPETEFRVRWWIEDGQAKTAVEPVK